MEITCYDKYGRVIENIVQWDVGQSISIKGYDLTSYAPQIHFANANSEKALVVESVLSGGLLSCQVPNSLARENLPIIMYIYDAVGETGKTNAITKIPVTPRPMPDDVVYTDDVGVISLTEVLRQAREYMNNSLNYSTKAKESEEKAKTSADAAKVSETNAAKSENVASSSATQAAQSAKEAKAYVGSPLVANTVSAMTDQTKIYVYTGSESGYTAGNWYYHNGSAWVSGGVYNSSAVNVDKTLTQDGYAADAKVTGDAVSSLKGDLAKLIEKEYYSNLVNPDNTTNGGYISSSGLWIADETYSTTDFIDISQLDRVVWYMNTKHPAWNNNVIFGKWDENKTFIRRIHFVSDGIAHDITSDVSDAKYLRLSYITDENTKVYLGNQSADGFVYEPYGLKSETITPSNEVIEARGTYENLGNRLENIDGQLECLISDIPNIVHCWGDSLTEGAQDHSSIGSYVSRASVLKDKLNSDWKMKNYGVGGEKSNTISARASGSWFYLDAGITIPGDGSTVNVGNAIHDKYGETQNFGNGVYSSSYGGWATVNPCYVNGVECTLQRANGSSPLTIKRNIAGDDITITRPTRIHFNSETFEKNPVLILCLGQNEGFNRNANILIEQIDGIIEHSKSDRYIVVGIPHSLYGYTWEKTINDELKRHYGKHYLDIEEYMKTPVYDADGETIVSSYALQDAGLTPTDADLTAISNNQYPPQIMFDSIHFNHYGYEVWANQEYELGKDLGYWN